MIPAHILKDLLSHCEWALPDGSFAEGLLLGFLLAKAPGRFEHWIAEVKKRRGKAALCRVVEAVEEGKERQDGERKRRKVKEESDGEIDLIVTNAKERK